MRAVKAGSAARRVGLVIVLATASASTTESCEPPPEPTPSPVSASVSSQTQSVLPVACQKMLDYVAVQVASTSVVTEQAGLMADAAVDVQTFSQADMYSRTVDALDAMNASRDAMQMAVVEAGEANSTLESAQTACESALQE